MKKLYAVLLFYGMGLFSAFDSQKFDKSLITSEISPNHLFGKEPICAHDADGSLYCYSDDFASYEKMIQEALDLGVFEPIQANRKNKWAIIHEITWSALALYRDEDYKRASFFSRVKIPVKSNRQVYKGSIKKIPLDFYNKKTIYPQPDTYSRIYNWIPTFYEHTYSLLTELLSPEILTEIISPDELNRRNNLSDHTAYYIKACMQFAYIYSFTLKSQDHIQSPLWILSELEGFSRNHFTAKNVDFLYNKKSTLHKKVCELVHTLISKGGEDPEFNKGVSWCKHILKTCDIKPLVTPEFIPESIKKNLVLRDLWQKSTNP